MQPLWAPVRLNSAGDVECAGSSGGCNWATSLSDCQNGLSSALQVGWTCGAQIKATYGYTGYNVPGHWCTLAKLALQSPACPVGQFKADDGTCTACTPVPNAASDAVHMCTNANDAVPSKCADGYSRITGMRGSESCKLISSCSSYSAQVWCQGGEPELPCSFISANKASICSTNNQWSIFTNIQGCGLKGTGYGCNYYPSSGSVSAVVILCCSNPKFTLPSAVSCTAGQYLDGSTCKSCSTVPNAATGATYTCTSAT
eukprot:Colp12_sorted_trinity150504_noHs@27597